MRSSPSFANTGFTLVELIVVIILLGILSAVALPKFLDISSNARVAALENIAGAMRTTISMTRAKARLIGLKPVATNPGGGQSAYLIESELGTAELDFRNLCPESSAELGNRLDMSDYMVISLTEDLTMTTDNQYTRIGFDITTSNTSGCYVVYNSFGLPDCTVTVVAADC